MFLFIFFHIHTFLLVLGHKTNHSQSFNTAVYIASQSTSIQDKLRHTTQNMHQTYCQRQFLCVQGINKSSRLLSRKSFNTLQKNHQRFLAQILCECLLGSISYNDNIYFVIIISSILWPLVVPVNVHNLFRARICGTGQLLQITPPTFLCELSNKIDQTLQWIESRSNGFNRARPNTNFNVQIFHDEIQIGANRDQKLKKQMDNWFQHSDFSQLKYQPSTHIYVQRATGIKKWTSGLITGNDERSSRVVAEAGQ